MANDIMFKKLKMSREIDFLLLLKYYHNVVSKCSTYEEIKSFDRFAQLYNYTKLNKNIEFVAILAINPTGDIIGGFIGDIFKKIKMGIGIYCNVREEDLNKGVEVRLARQFEKLTQTVIMELEDPEKVKKEDKEKVEAKIKMWSELGLEKLNIEYIRPPLDDNQNPKDYYNMYAVGKNAKKPIQPEKLISFFEYYFAHFFNCKRDTKYKHLEYVGVQLLAQSQSNSKAGQVLTDKIVEAKEISDRETRNASKGIDADALVEAIQKKPTAKGKKEKTTE